MMKTSFKKLRGLGLYNHDKHDHHAVQRSLPQLDELSQASQDMQDMKDCYESLLSAAAGITNNAYEFSESLQEMGDCLLEKTALSDDEDSGRVLLMLGKVQFDIQKLFDNYRSHISQTITVPSESLLNELQIVEEMKKQCDEERMIYEAMKIQYDKGRMENSKGEHISSRQLESARADFDEAATLFIFRMKSLKRGQSHSLLTQAARHYAAQICFFRKALKSLEAIEPQVRLTTEQQHIEYRFSGLEDDDRDSVFLTNDEDDEDDSDHYNDTREDDELNTNSYKNEVSSSGNPMKLGNEDLTFLRVASVNTAKASTPGKTFWNSDTMHRDLNRGSKSAPLSAETTFDPYEKYRQMRQSSTRKLNTYPLPTPQEKISKNENFSKNENNSGPIVLSNQSVLKEINHNSTLTQPPISIQVDSFPTSTSKKMKTEAFSAPLTGARKSKMLLPHSGPLLRASLTHSLSASGASSNRLSLPVISELHELPRPPFNLASKKPSKVSFSAPLVAFRRAEDLIDTNKSLVRNAVYTLPEPLRSERDTSALASKQTESWIHRGDVALVSPPRSPIVIRNV